jgi:glycosidase
MKKRIALIGINLILILSACGIRTPVPTPTPTISPVPTASSTFTPIPTAIPVRPLTGMPQGTGGYSWWNYTTFYEIFVRSFSDSNGDGIGDFNGITQKLDYLQSLGITGLWLMPINPSPSYHGYDVTDYYAVNQDYGTMEDFKKLLSEAHKRGIRIILDLVLNHTSSKHPWFQQAIDPKSPYHDWYIWSDTDPGYPGPWGERVWYQDRLMTQLGGDAGKVKAAASMLLTSPGVPFVYYGEELGLEGGGKDEYKRRPMQWSAEANAGFSPVTPWEPIGPDYQTFNAVSESDDPNSILTHYQDLIRIRNQHVALRVGDFSLITSSASGIYCILRVSQGSGAAASDNEAVLVLVNLTKTSISNYNISLDKSSLPSGSYHLVPIMGSGPTTDLTAGPSGIISWFRPIGEVPAYGTLILQLQPVSSIRK